MLFTSKVRHRWGRYIGLSSDQQGDNPLLWMVARIFWYKIVHVGDFILSLLRQYLFFFSYIYLLIPSYRGPRGEPPFFQTSIFFAVPSNDTNSHKSLIFFYGSFLNFGTNSYKLIHTIVIQIV